MVGCQGVRKGLRSTMIIAVGVLLVVVRNKKGARKGSHPSSSSTTASTMTTKGLVRHLSFLEFASALKACSSLLALPSGMVYA